MLNILADKSQMRGEKCKFKKKIKKTGNVPKITDLFYFFVIRGNARHSLAIFVVFFGFISIINSTVGSFIITPFTWGALLSEPFF